MAKCMQCGGMKKATKMKKGGVKKMAAGGSTTNKLNNARGFAPEQKGGDNISKMIYGIPNAGMTGPNRKSQTETMKKGGAKKATAKKPLMKKGGAMKPLRKAQNGDTIIGTPSLKDVGVKNIYQGPLNESDYKNLNTLYPINNESPRLESTVMAPRAVQKDKSVMGPKVRMSQSSGNEYMRNRVANYLRSGKTLDNDGENIYAPTEKELYSVEGKKRGGATKSIMKKGGAVKKYAKGGSKFPDLTGDGKVTQADILKGRGVIKKKGGTVKAQFGKTIRAKAATRKVNKDKGYFTYSNDDKQSTVYNAYSKEGKTNALKKREIENRLKAKGMPIMKGSYIPNNPSETKYSKVVKKSGGAVKAKFGASVSVQRSPKAGKVRSASAQGYSAVGKREPGRIIKKTISKKK